jgi:PGF-CTERM protein
MDGTTDSPTEGDGSPTEGDGSPTETATESPGFSALVALVALLAAAALAVRRRE